MAATAGGRRGRSRPVFLGEAVLRLLRVLAPQAGGVLVLEDLHWADRETLALLEYLADNLAAERVLCLATLRDGRRRSGRAGQRARGARVRRRAAAGPPGPGGDGATWPGPAWTPPTCRTRCTAVVAERAEGIPFLVEEVLAGLVGRGR